MSGRSAGRRRRSSHPARRRHGRRASRTRGRRGRGDGHAAWRDDGTALRLPARGPVVGLEDELLAVVVVDLRPRLDEAELREDRLRREVVRRGRGAEPTDTAFAVRPLEQRPDDLGRDALAAELRLDPIADLDLAGLVGWSMEPDRPDDLSTRARVVEHDRPPEPRLPGLIGREIGDPELEKMLEVVGHVGRHLGADQVLCRGQIAPLQGLHERQRHRDELEPGGPDRRDGRHPGIFAPPGRAGT